MLGVALLYLTARPVEPQTILTCDVQLQAGSRALRIGSTSVALDRLRIEGSFSGDGKNGLYHYDGRSDWIMSGQKADGTVTGTIFTDTDKAVEGLYLRIAHPRFGQKELKLATLN